MFTRLPRSLPLLTAPLRLSRTALTVTSTRTNASAPLLANIEASWKELPSEEQYQVYQQLGEIQKKDWKELSLDEKKAGESLSERSKRAGVVGIIRAKRAYKGSDGYRSQRVWERRRDRLIIIVWFADLLSLLLRAPPSSTTLSATIPLLHSCLNSSPAHRSAAYFVAFGPHGPRSPMHGPNHGLNVFLWTAGCIVSSVIAFAIIKQYGTSIPNPLLSAVTS